MQPRTLLALCFAVLALGAFIFVYEQDLPSTDERAGLAKKVLRLEDDDVEALLIEWGEESVRLERRRPAAGGDGEDDAADAVPAAASAGGWRIVSPLDARADGGAVDGLLGALTGLESSRAFEDFDRGELGLDDPRARVTLVAGGGQSVLEVGAELPASSDMVVAVAGGAKAYQVASSLFDDLVKAPGDWRDKKLFAGPRSDVDRLMLDAGAAEVTPEGGQREVTPEGGRQKVLLAKRGDDFWIESPLADRADEELVNTLLSELTGLRAESFLDEPLLTPESMGLEPPQSILEVVLAGREQPFRLELGSAVTADGGSPSGDEGTFYGRVESQLVEIKTRLPESLAVTAADWRSKSWTALQVFKVETAGFEDAEGSLEISRDGADWQRGEDRIGYTVVSDLLYPITDAKGRQVLDRAAAAAAGHDLAQASLKITLAAKDAEQLLAAEELSLFPVIGGFAAATSGDRDAVLLLGEDDAGEILEKLQALRDAEPLPGEDEEDETAEPAAE